MSPLQSFSDSTNIKPLRVTSSCKKFGVIEPGTSRPSQLLDHHRAYSRTAFWNGNGIIVHVSVLVGLPSSSMQRKSHDLVFSSKATKLRLAIFCLVLINWLISYRWQNNICAIFCDQPLLQSISSSSKWDQLKREKMSWYEQVSWQRRWCFKKQARVIRP